MISVKDHEKYEEVKKLLAEGNSTRFVSEKLNISREIVCAISRTVFLTGNK